MLHVLARTIGLVVCLVGALAIPCLATNPDPFNCTWDDWVGCSPKNTIVPGGARYVFSGYLRDDTGAPVCGFSKTQIHLDFSECTCPHTRPDDWIQSDVDSECDGYVYWSANLNFGGSCPCRIHVRVSGLIFKTLDGDGTPVPPSGIDGGLRSVDANGNGIVALDDLSVFQQEFVNTGVRHDYRGDLAQPFDGITSLVDLSWFREHFIG